MLAARGVGIVAGQAVWSLGHLNACGRTGEFSLASEISGHALSVKVNPAFVRSNEIARLSGDRSKLESLIAAPAPRNFSETLRWMIQYLD